MSVSIRKVETEVHETGVGVDNRIDVTYELGGDVDGTFVPFARITQSHVDQAKARAEAEKATADKAKDAGK